MLDLSTVDDTESIRCVDATNGFSVLLYRDDTNRKLEVGPVELPGGSGANFKCFNDPCSPPFDAAYDKISESGSIVYYSVTIPDELLMEAKPITLSVYLPPSLPARPGTRTLAVFRIPVYDRVLAQVREART